MQLLCANVTGYAFKGVRQSDCQLLLAFLNELGWGTRPINVVQAFSGNHRGRRRG